MWCCCERQIRNTCKCQPLSDCSLHIFISTVLGLVSPHYTMWKGVHSFSPFEVIPEMCGLKSSENLGGGSSSPFWALHCSPTDHLEAPASQVCASARLFGFWLRLQVWRTVSRLLGSHAAGPTGVPPILLQIPDPPSSQLPTFGHPRIWTPSTLRNYLGQLIPMASRAWTLENERLSILFLPREA